jgi:osmotically inducible protein OsmC
MWEGGLKGGKGRMKVGKTGYEGPFTFASRFEEGAGTNPEELIAAAHAGCFSMALSAELEKAGHAPKSVNTTATVTIIAGTGITGVRLETRASVPGIGKDEFLKIAEGAKTGCPVSKALAAVKIELDAQLV